MANAGIDRSNIGVKGTECVLLLPKDADASAAHLRAGLMHRLDAAPAIVISDSFGRPWRNGVVNVALGASGLPALIDRRGQPDRDGRLLEVTQIGFGDMLASAAGLVIGEGHESVPAALMRGLSWAVQDTPASALIRPLEQDLFR
jgi:coenzyme F420-0:L-glutamate ligase/coenzyme F420-1:gamma-L-glutamate ligase